MDNSLLNDFCAKMEEKRFEIHGVVVRKDGEIIASHRWRADERVHIYSASKSFASIGIGIARDEGLLDLDDKIAPMFSDKLGENPDERVFDISIRHLLTMASGHGEGFLFGKQKHTYTEKDWERFFFSQPLAYAPGEKFVYNNGCSYMLSAIITKKTGLSLRDYLLPRLFDVLEIGNPQWFSCPMGRSSGGNGLFLRTEELSRFGQMLLDGGVYNKKRVVSEEYLSMATTKQIDAGDYGYGFQFWICERPGSYMASGLYDQLAIVVPDKNAVVTVNAHVEKDNEQVHRAIWDDIIAKL